MEVIEPDQISVVLHIQCNHGNAAIVFNSAEYCSYYESHNEATHSEPVVLLEQTPTHLILSWWIIYYGRDPFPAHFITYYPYQYCVFAVPTYHFIFKNCMQLRVIVYLLLLMKLKVFLNLFPFNFKKFFAHILLCLIRLNFEHLFLMKVFKI